MSEPSDPVAGGNPLDLLASARQALAAQAEAAQRTVEGSAGGGAVKVRMTGAGEITGIALAREAVDPDDIEMLQDLILAAIRDATTQVTELHSQALGPLGQLDLGAIGGLFGAGGASGAGGAGEPGQ